MPVNTRRRFNMHQKAVPIQINVSYNISMQYEQGNGSRLLTAGAGLKQSAYMRTLILITIYKIIIIFRCTFCNVSFFFFSFFLELFLSFWVENKEKCQMNWQRHDRRKTVITNRYQSSNWCIALAFSIESIYPWRERFGFMKYKIIYFIRYEIQKFVSFKQFSRMTVHFIFAKSIQPLIW